MSQKKIEKKMYRQGDVLIVAVDKMPDGAKELPRSKRGVVLAEGEVTGHAHRITARHASLYRTEDDARYLRVGGSAGPAQLKHEEHKTVTLPKGDYRITIHHEYEPEAIRRVED